MIVVRPRMDLVRPSHMTGTVALQSTAADVHTVLVDGEFRKKDGRLVGQDLAAVRDRANAALDRIREGHAKLPKRGPEEIGGWFGAAERMASRNFSDAYADGVPA
ncbi:hypothetical protein [Actinomadura sp. NPDC048394]|uniref:hypothetical protein n=1 Tax=Actinomadura sp. NPDC048394 TaxID=3158223 RepID=UPI0033C2D576